MSGSGNTITGAVHSDGGLNLSGGSQSLGPTTIASPLSSCLTGNLSSDTYNGAAQPLTVSPIVTWPEDYSQIFTACGGTGQVACSGPGGTPSYCTQACGDLQLRQRSGPRRCQATCTALTAPARQRLPRPGMA